MARWKIGAGLLVLFVSGILIGSVGTRMYVRHKISCMVESERPVMRDFFLRRITRELDLTEEQRKEVEQIANRTAEKFHELQKQHRTQLQGILDQAVSDMKQYLSPDQQQKLDEIRKKMKAWHKRRRHRPPPPDMLEHPPLPPPPPPPPPPE